jgi:hypothetical protein
LRSTPGPICRAMKSRALASSRKLAPAERPTL